MSDTKTSSVLRRIALCVAILFTGSLALLVYHQFHIRSGDPVPLIVERVFGCVSGLVEATIASFCWWYGLRGHLRTQTRTGQVASVVGFSLLGGVIFGGIGFALGFFGPIIIGSITSTDSPQGPLLGIFITGPLGFVVGVMAGFIYGLIRSLKQKSQQTQPNTALEPTPTAPPVLPKP